jgi:hypothetical protein
VGPRALAASFEQYAELMAAEPDDYLERWKMRFPSTAETEDEILRLEALAAGVEAQSALLVGGLPGSSFPRRCLGFQGAWLKSFFEGGETGLFST